MSYAGPAGSRPKRSPTVRQTSFTPPAETDWQEVIVFGAGVALGIAIGAGVALLTAPRSGSETRRELRHFASRQRDAVSERLAQRRRRRAARREARLMADLEAQVL